MDFTFYLRVYVTIKPWNMTCIIVTIHNMIVMKWGPGVLTHAFTKRQLNTYNNNWFTCWGSLQGINMIHAHLLSVICYCGASPNYAHLETKQGSRQRKTLKEELIFEIGGLWEIKMQKRLSCDAPPVSVSVELNRLLFRQNRKCCLNEFLIRLEVKLAVDIRFITWRVNMRVDNPMVE